MSPASVITVILKRSEVGERLVETFETPFLETFSA